MERLLKVAVSGVLIIPASALVGFAVPGVLGWVVSPIFFSLLPASIYACPVAVAFGCAHAMTRDPVPAETRLRRVGVAFIVLTTLATLAYAWHTMNGPVHVNRV